MKKLSFVPKIGLFYKIAVPVLLTLIVGIGVTTAVSIREQTTTIGKELIKKNKTVSTHLASSVKNAFWSLNWLFVERQMQEITKSEDVTFLKLIKPNGEIYMSSGDMKTKEGLLIPGLTNIEEQAIKEISFSDADGPVKVIITPIKVGDDKWSLIMGLSLKQVEHSKRAILRENIILGSTIFLFGVLISFFFARGMTKPIRLLAKGTKEIGKGNLDYRIEIKCFDELGSLANSFNKMAEDLKKTTTSRDQLAVEIDERKRAEEALRESENRFRLAAECASDLIYEWDIATDYLKWFGDIDGALGFGQGEIRESIEEWMALIHPDDQGRLAATVSHHRESGDPLYVEYSIRRKDGTWRYWTDRGVAILDDTNKPFRLIGVCTDITEQRRLEAQLLKAQKMEAIGTLAGGVAHDLNNVLSGIVSYPDLILTDLPEDSPLRKPILTIQQSGQKAAAIVQDLLTLARRGVVATEVTNLTKIMEIYFKSPECENLKEFHPDAKIEINLEPNLLNIMGSPVHMSKTVMNLVSNAAEAMPEGGNIFISTENRYIDKPITGYDVKEGDYVILTVSDTGVGISSGDLERIFEPFYTKKVMGRSGTGLGMAVVWGTVKDHKGYIDVQSTKGKGTTFTLYFPVTRKEIREKEEAPPMEEYLGKGESVLVVDDVKEQREIASRILTRLNYAVTSVSNGEEAFDYMKDNSADILVLDMIMDPGIDGLETYKRILELHPGQKAIIASGFSETDRVKETQRLGAGKYIKKPYTLEKIGLAVKRELEE